jgi:hypothetical protein
MSRFGKRKHEVDASRQWFSEFVSTALATVQDLYPVVMKDSKDAKPKVLTERSLSTNEDLNVRSATSW